MRRLWVGAIVAAVAVPAVVAIQRDETPALATSVEDVVATGVPGILVRLRDGNDVREAAGGDASVGDRFRVGSVTKTFVAALALQLAEGGALSLDDRVELHVPGLLRDGDRASVRDLLGHTTGLFDYAAVRELRDGSLAPRALVARADREDRVNGYLYSSTNYLALGLVVEAAADAPLGRLLKRHVFERFGLDRTTFEPGRVLGPYLHGHERSLRDGVATGRYRDTDGRSAGTAWAAGAAVSTTADLDRFFTLLLRDDLGRQMSPRGDARYGLGLARFETECGPVVGHTGNVLGMVTVVWTRGERVLVAAASVYPLTPAQETSFQALLTQAYCG